MPVASRCPEGRPDIVSGDAAPRLGRDDMTSIPSPSDDSFVAFRARLMEPSTLERLSLESAWHVDALTERLAIAVGEVAQTLKVLGGFEVPEGARLLEVGAGLGLTSAYLSSCGFDVWALEPAAIGFEEHAALASSVATVVGSAHELLTIGAAELDPALHGAFDVIFSNNVLEHIDDLDAAVRAMNAVRSPNGVMVHSCPNYSVPFEPHFGVPLVPGRPAWTRRVLPASIGSDSVWTSLNFVRARDIRRLAVDLGLRLDFRGGSLATSIERLGTDAEFRARHRALAVVGRVLVASRITAASASAAPVVVDAHGLRARPAWARSECRGAVAPRMTPGSPAVDAWSGS